MCQQWRMAEAADRMVKVSWGQLILTGLSLLGLGATIYFASRAARIAGDANEVARAVGRDQTRAYVHISSIRWIDDEDGLLLTLFVQNSGETPAKSFEVSVSAQSFTFPKTPIDLPFAKKGRWHSLPGNTTFSAGMHVELGPRNTVADVTCINGIVKYTTFYNEVFETGFEFFGFGIGRQKDTDKGQDNRDGTMMTRSQKAVESFKLIEPPPH